MYNKEEIEKQALEAIQSKKLIFIEEIVSYLDCGKVTFYDMKLNKSNTLKQAILKNKIDIKAGLRKKWYINDNATTDIALYKLTGTDEERRLLSTNYNENNDTVHQTTKIEISDELLKEIAQIIINE